MKIKISSVNFKIDDGLRSFIRRKVSKLFNQYDKILRANVVLRQIRKRNHLGKSCDIKLEVPGNDHFVTKSSEVYQKSVSQAVEVLQKILRRTKSKVIAKRYAL